MTSVIAYTVLAITMVALLHHRVLFNAVQLLYHYKSISGRRTTSVEAEKSQAYARQLAVCRLLITISTRVHRLNADVGTAWRRKKIPAYPFVTVQLPIYNTKCMWWSALSTILPASIIRTTASRSTSG